MYVNSLDGTKIHYIYRPSLDDKGTLVFIHGGGFGNNTLMKKIYKNFPDFNIIAPDRRGCGLSSFPSDYKNVKLEDYARDISPSFDIIKSGWLLKETFIGWKGRPLPGVTSHSLERK